MKIQAIILAGGKSSRMGVDKSLLCHNGKPLIQSVIDLLDEMHIPSNIISDNPNHRRFGKDVHGDILRNVGPLGGIHAGLTHSKTDKVLVLCCDYPNLNRITLEELIDNSSNQVITICESEGRLHPLIGVYDKSCIPVIEKCVQNQTLRVSDLFKNMENTIIKMDRSPEVFRNINTPEEMKEAGIGVRLLFFGLIAELLKKEQDLIPFILYESELDLRTFLSDRYPELKELDYSIAVDQVITNTLQAGVCPKEIAILPPFAGG